MIYSLHKGRSLGRSCAVVSGTDGRDQTCFNYSGSGFCGWAPAGCYRGWRLFLHQNRRVESPGSESGLLIIQKFQKQTQVQVWFLPSDAPQLMFHLDLRAPPPTSSLRFPSSAARMRRATGNSWASSLFTSFSSLLLPPLGLPWTPPRHLHSFKHRRGWRSSQEPKPIRNHHGNQQEEVGLMFWKVLNLLWC